MESNMTTSQHMIKNENNVNLNNDAVAAGSSKRFRGVPESADYITQRPQMVVACSQTSEHDFSYLNELEIRELQLQREKHLEERVRELQENLKQHRELLAQIHATSMKTSALLKQKQSQNQQNTDNTGSNENNIHSFSNGNVSPKIVNSINNSHQSSSPAESIKYTIIAENEGDQIDEPIEIQLAEEDGALNLNSSTDSGRLEICLAPEENIQIKTENNAANNTMRIEHQPAVIPSDSTPIEHHFINKCNLAAGQSELPVANTNYESNQTIESFNNTQLKLPTKKRRISVNNIIQKKPKMLTAHNISPTMPSTSNQHIHHSPPYHNFSQSPNGIDTDKAMISIGPNNTQIPKKIYDSMNWSSASAATRKLLMTIFGRNILATHSMTGKPSPAFKDHQKPVKQMLDPVIISDIIFAVTRKCNVSDKEVRSSITTKCADENKMMKLQMNKRAPMKEINNKENLSE